MSFVSSSLLPDLTRSAFGVGFLYPANPMKTGKFPPAQGGAPEVAIMWPNNRGTSAPPPALFRLTGWMLWSAAR